MTPTERDELQALLDALCEETITPEQVRRLEEMVLAHPEAEALLRPVHEPARRPEPALRCRPRPCRAGPSGTASNPRGPRPSRHARRPPRRLAATVDGRRWPLSRAACSWPSACGRGRS